MSATNTPMVLSGDKSYEEVCAAWRATYIRPLWENPMAHKVRAGGPRPHLWKWSILRRGHRDHPRRRRHAALGTEGHLQPPASQLDHPLRRQREGDSVRGDRP
jgi:hypothetical protein